MSQTYLLNELNNIQNQQDYDIQICVKRSDLILIYKENKSWENILNRIEIEMCIKDNLLTDLMKNEKFNLNNTSDINDDDINKLCNNVLLKNKEKLNLDYASIEYIKTIIKQSSKKNHIIS